MANGYWSSFNSGWGWFLWFGFVLLMVSNFGNWGYTYRAHRRLEDGASGKNAMDILNERYARGEIKEEEYTRIKSSILPTSAELLRRVS